MFSSSLLGALFFLCLAVFSGIALVIDVGAEFLPLGRLTQVERAALICVDWLAHGLVFSYVLQPSLTLTIHLAFNLN